MYRVSKVTQKHVSFFFKLIENTSLSFMEETRPPDSCISNTLPRVQDSEHNIIHQQAEAQKVRLRGVLWVIFCRIAGISETIYNAIPRRSLFSLHLKGNAVVVVDHTIKFFEELLSEVFTHILKKSTSDLSDFEFFSTNVRMKL